MYKITMLSFLSDVKFESAKRVYKEEIARWVTKANSQEENKICEICLMSSYFLLRFVSLYQCFLIAMNTVTESLS